MKKRLNAKETSNLIENILPAPVDSPDALRDDADIAEAIGKINMGSNERSGLAGVQTMDLDPERDENEGETRSDLLAQSEVLASPHDIDVDPDDYSSQAGKDLEYQEVTRWFGSNYERVQHFVASRGELKLGDGGASYTEGFNLIQNDVSTSMGNKTITKTWNAYEKIVGGDGDDVIYGAGRLSLAEGNYDHNDVIFGGKGNDTIYGLEGDDTLSGGAGNDRIYGGAGNDEIYGGSGNDIIDGGGGADTLYGGSGNDWIFSGAAEAGQGQTEMFGGSGSDVFVIGDRSGFEQNNEPFDWQGLATNMLYTVGGLIPQVGGYIKGVKKIVDALPLATGDEASGNTWDGSNAVVVRDFNPAEDVLIIPLNRDGTPNAHLKFDGLVAGEAFRIYEDAQSTKLIAVVYWADLSKTLGVDFSQLSATEIAAFQSSIQHTMLVMDSEQVINGSGQTIDLGAEDLSGLGSGRYLVVGSHSGQVVNGSNQSDYLFGTGHNDVISGYNYATGANPVTAGDDVLYGFGGDDLFITGGGSNTVYGGAGSDTAAYFDASAGITVDMTDLTTNARGDYFVIRAKYRDAEGNIVTSTDRLYSVENIIGTDHVDRFIGDANDNTFVSGLGNDIMTGGAGADTFVLNGGHNKITDFNQDEGDRVVVDMQQYNLNAHSDVFVHSDGQGGFRLVRHNDPNQVIVEFTSESGDSIAVGIMDKNGDVRFYLSNSDDVFTMSETDSYLQAQSGNDTIYGSEAAESIYGSGGNDLIHGGGGNDYINGGNDDDTIYGDDGNDFIRGGRGDDTLYGGNGNDIIFSGGSDQSWQYGWDRLYGGDGDDALIHDGPNKAHLFGENGNDELYQREGNSHMWGGAGDDLLVVSGGFTEASGGAGKDTFVMDGGKMRIVDYDIEDVILVDYESYGYSSADDIVYGWQAVSKDGVMEYYDKSSGELMLEVQGDWTGYSGPSIKPTTGDWGEMYI